MNRANLAAIPFTILAILCIAFAVWSVARRSLLGVIVSACAMCFAVQIYRYLRLP